MRIYFILIIFVNTLVITEMAKREQAFQLKLRQINNKQYLVPVFNLFQCQKYMLPKLDNADVHHTFFNPQDIQQVYKQMKVDPEQLNHNLDKSKAPEKNIKKKSQHKIDDLSISSINDLSIEESSVVSDQSYKFNFNKRPRPALRQKGYTHFIHVPLWDALKNMYQNQIVPRIQEEDRDLLQPLSSMHLTVMVFRLKKMQDLPLWSQVLKTAKKTKISIKGVNIFSVKKNYAKVLFLNVKGIQDLVDRVVSKAIQLKLVEQSQLSHIKFDKVTQKYKSQPHISLLRTKGEDLYDFTEYLRIFGKLSVAKATISQIRLSMIGSHDGSDYYNQQIVNL